jgi:hypothetical protein
MVCGCHFWVMFPSGMLMPSQSHTDRSQYGARDPCLSRSMPFQIHAFPDPCLSRSMPLEIHASRDPCLSRSMPLEIHAYRDPCLSRSMPLEILASEACIFLLSGCWLFLTYRKHYLASLFLGFTAIISVYTTGIRSSITVL